MKRAALFLSLIFLCNMFMELQAQDKPAPVVSAIGQVTVFLSGAEVQREGSVQLKVGMQWLVFENLPQQINLQSIQVSGNGNFTILDVSHRINYLKSVEKSKEVGGLERSMEILNEKIVRQTAAVQVLEAEKEMLKKNQYIGGSQTGVKMAELKEFADYFRARLNDLSVQEIKAMKEIGEWREEKERIEMQLEVIRQRQQMPTSEVVVAVTAPIAGAARLNLTYLVYEAGWSPLYDLRASDVNNPVELIYKASVYQSTGEEWKNIKPVFSTANPMLNNTKPVLMPWYLSFYQPMPRASHSNMFQSAMAPEAKREEVAMEDHIVVDEKAFTSPVFSVQENQTSVEFAIDVPYTIPSDGQPHSVELAKYSLPATYEYCAVRKLEKDVFLLAKATGWEKLNLLSGSANVFFEGKFVGATYIETRQTDDTLALSLGRDKNITVTRVRKKDFAEKQLLSSGITETREWDLTVHNKKKQEINIIIEDQIPVSTEKDIKVEAVNVSQAQVDKESGKLTWRYTLKPSESRSMNVKYTVRYPKGRTVILE